MSSIFLSLRRTLPDLWRGDLRFAWRNVLRRPGFTLLVVLTLALGLGVNGAMFALIDAVLLRPLPYKDAERLVFVWQTLPRHGVFELEATPADYTAWQRARSFDALALVSADSFTLTGDPEPQRVQGTRSTSTLIPLLGVAPRLGRSFEADEDDDVAPPVVILSDALWRSRYGSDPAIVGRPVHINGVAHTVVGVMPPHAVPPGRLASHDAIWLPARMPADERTNEISHNYTVVGRLTRTSSVEQASAEMAALAASQAADRPATHNGVGGRVVSVSEDTVREIRPVLLLLMAAVSLLLLTASANVATLLLARASTRQRETAIRVALGAGRGRLLSLAMAECLLMAGLGAAAGLAFGASALKVLLPLFSSHLPRAASVAIDMRVAGFTVGVALMLGACLTLVMATQRPRHHLTAALKSGSRGSGGPQAGRARALLVVAQVALSVLLLSAAGLLVRSFVRLQHVDPGFAAEHVLTFRQALPDAGYPSDVARRAFIGNLVESLVTIPAVESVAINSALPLGGSYAGNGVAIEGRPAVAGELIIAGFREITPDYFNALGIPLIAGRVFTARDDDSAEPVAIVNQTMARKWWPDGNPVGRRIRITAGPQSADGWLRIVGIVGDVRHNGLARPPASEGYRPYAQVPRPTFSVVIRTAGDATAIVPAVRARVREIDRNLPLYDVRTMQARVASSFAEARATALLLLSTAVLAMSLAAVAIYGSIWYTVTERIPEIGIRLALGASRLSVCGDVVRRALTMTAIGTALGTALSLGANAMLAGLLFNTRWTDPATYAAVVAALIALTIAASLVPARHATRVDPMAALRQE
jgi:putative ABC transport system permease protein